MDLVTSLRECSREDMPDAELRRQCHRGLLKVVEACREDLSEEALTGVAFIALREDGTALAVVAGEVYEPARRLFRAVQGAL